MRGLDPTEPDDSGVVFRDMITLMLCGFVACVVLVLPHINPARASRSAAGMEPPGNVVVEARWADALDADVDLWVQGPGDVPVGYSNKGGRLFNLLRDDLGRRSDATDLNYEVAYSRGIPTGEYTVNLQLYRNIAQRFPVVVRVVVSVKKSAEESSRPLVATELNLNREGQELTAFRFRLDSHGELVPNSLHSLFKELRNWKPA